MVRELELLAQEREELVRFCARLTGSGEVAEDLAQITLLEAWQHRTELRNDSARRAWLLAIARNTCYRWARNHGRERTRRAEPLDDVEVEVWDAIADGFDLQVELERHELARLLDRALALLPPDTRDVLVRRYLDEVSQAEVAAQLRLTEGAVEARLHRGKLALRHSLCTKLGDESLAHGLIGVGEVGWQETRIWCPGCGTRRLEGWLAAEAGRLDLRCPRCAPIPYDNYTHSHLGDGLRGIRTFKPALSRVLTGIHQMFHYDAVGGGMPCPLCRRWMPLQQSREQGVSLECPRCNWLDQETWHSLSWSLPEVRRFWQKHPRMRFIPEREVEAEGVPAMVTAFESVTGGARLEVVTLRESLRVVHISGAPPEPPLTRHDPAL